MKGLDFRFGWANDLFAAGISGGWTKNFRIRRFW